MKGRKRVRSAIVSIVVSATVTATICSPLCHGFSGTEKNNPRNVRTTSSVFSLRPLHQKLLSETAGNETPKAWIPNVQRMATSACAALLTVAISTSGIDVFGAEPIGFPRAQICHALTPDQLLVDDVWREVSRQFVDPTYNGQGEDGWKKQRLLALERASDLGPDDERELYQIIRGMLKTLNDPYTRFLTPDQFESMTTAYASPTMKQSTEPTPSTAGIGVQLLGDKNNSASGMVIVANTIGQSPAEIAGILPGDRIRAINGVDMVGATAEVVAAKCRGEIGTTITIDLERPPVEGTKATETEKISLMVARKPLMPTPMLETTTTIVSTSRADYNLGVLKINSFTQETEKAVREQLQSMKEQRSLSAIVLDLRGNVGGYMPAGVDVAKLFLTPKSRIVSEVDKTGRKTIYINDGVGSDTSTPLYLVVDKRTASASEILAAALQDNERATVVSKDSRTFGKGRIQNVQAVQGGSGIAVTKAKYITPSGKDIQGVGILPDVLSETCNAKDSAAICLEGIL